MLIFLLIITFSWGIGNVLVKKGFQKLTPWQSYAFDAFLIAFPLWVGYGIITGGNLDKVTIPVIAIALFVSFTYALYYYTINIGEISLTSSIIATYPAFTLILAYFLLHERLNTIASIGIISTVIGVISISIPTKINFRWEKWVILSILVAIGYGISGYLQKLALGKIDNASYLIVLAIAQVIAVSIWRIFHHEHLPKIKFDNLIYSFLGIFLFNIGNIAYFIALEKGFASIVVPLSNTYITITVILSLIYLKEKITRIQLLGIISVIIGVVLVSLTNNTISKPPESQNQNSISKTVSTPTVIRESVVITYVLDGDTIEIVDGRKVRLIGIDTPELNTDTGSSQCFATEAAKITKQLLENQTVELEKDKEDTDKYGRLLRYVYSDGVFINEFLLRQGYGRTMSIPPNTKYIEEFKEAENEAKNNKRGLWKNCN